MNQVLIEEARKVFNSTNLDTKKIFISKIDSIMDTYVSCLDITLNQKHLIEARLKEYDFLKTVLQKDIGGIKL